MEKTNKHHVYPTSRLNGTGIVGVCYNRAKQKCIYFKLLGDKENIIEAFNYLNERFWGNTFIVDHIYKTNKGSIVDKVALRYKSKRKTKKPLICKVSKKKHELYHQLFGNMLPEEILNFLNTKFWKNTFVLEEKKINGFKAPVYSQKLALA